MTLRTLLETIRDRPNLLPVPDWPPYQIDSARLERDMEWVAPETNEAVKKLIVWRNNMFAHRNIKWATSKAGLAKAYPIPDAEVSALVDNGFEIAQRYYGQLFGVHHESFGSPLLDDFTRTIGPLDETLTKQRAAQLQQLNADIDE